jgi:hypothetical protein
MKRQVLLWSLPATIGLSVMIVASSAECAYARPRGGGGFGRGGFSREGPASAGSFASHSGSVLGRGNFQASRQQFASGAQANRMDYGQQAQASRQQEANALQSSREQAAKSMQSSAQQYRGSYPYRGVGYPAWDAGAGLAAAATGAAIGATAAAATAAPAGANTAYPASLPCAAPLAVPIAGETFLRCGSSWYRQAYGPAGPTYIAVTPPGL